MPQIRSKQIKGETPINPSDLTTKEYVDSLIGSGGTSTLKIQDEGSDVLTGVTILNFIGTDVTVLADGVNKVNIFIPLPNYAPNFNTSGATISNITTYNRYVSNPTSIGNPFDIGDWTSGTIHSTIRSNVTNLVYSTPSSFSIYNNSTSFTAIVYGANGTTILAQNTMILSGNTSNTSSNITLNVTSWSSDSDRYKASISVSINIASIIPNGGRFSIRLVHNNNGTDYIFTQNNIFRDSETLTANISGDLTVYTGTTIQVKQISGVYFYTTNTEWVVNLNGINYLNSRSYPITKQLMIIDNNFYCASDLTVINGSGLTSWTNSHDNSNAIYNKNNWITDQINGSNWNGSGLTNTYATASVYDWSDTIPVSSINSINYNYLIDTYVDYSDRNSEMFRSESGIYPRLMSDCTTSWDFTQPLDSYDGGTGLQIIGDRLVYPQYNFNYEPNISSQPNYTTTSGDKSYYRKFETSGPVMYNVIISLSGHNITESDISSGNVKFEISVDKIKWLNIRYEFFVFDGGTSCRIEPDVYNLTSTSSIKATFENFRPEYSYNFTSTIYLKITYSDIAKDKYINSIDMMGDYWA